MMRVAEYRDAVDDPLIVGGGGVFLFGQFCSGAFCMRLRVTFSMFIYVCVCEKIQEPTYTSIYGQFCI